MESTTSEIQQLSMESKPMRTKNEKKEEKKFLLKTPKGTTDFGPEEMAVRDQMFQTITNVFRRHGAVTIDTPVFELKEILQGKYGEEAKLIYDLNDQGGELCSLRYDLTVPLARYLAMHGKTQLKRYQVAKVYRRDQPAMQKGRRREFLQCDLDLVGTGDPMVYDAEVLTILVDVLTHLSLPTFMIKVNHRLLLEGLLQVCGVDPCLLHPIASAIDKLDKCPWSVVHSEMLAKGISEASANAIHEYVLLKGGKELIQHLRTHPALSSSLPIQTALNDMELLFEYLEVYGIDAKVSFDLSLARGLDYYTGMIFEAILLNEPTTLEIQAKQEHRPKTSKSQTHEELPREDASDQVGLGSIAAGGRYDGLVGMFVGPSKKTGVVPQVPCVGLSLGVERLFSVLWKDLQHPRPKSTLVYVMSVGDGLLKERMQICRELWDAGIPTEFMNKIKPRLQAQFAICERDQIPWGVLLGPEELLQGVVKIKDMRQKTEGEASGGVLVQRTQLVHDLRRRIEEMETSICKEEHK